MALLATQTLTRAGLNPAYSAAAGGGDTFAPSAYTFLHVKNGSGGSINVTVAVQVLLAGDIDTSDVVVAVAAGAEKVFGPFPPEAFTNSAGVAAVTYSGVTSLTLAAIKIQKP